MTENEHRGEVEITFAGKPMVMRPTFDAMTRIERATGMTLMSLMRRYASQDWGMYETAVIICEGLRAGSEGKDGPDVKRVGDQLMLAGMTDYVAPIVEFVSQALGGTSEGNGKAATRKAK
jgi:hypothetical protein